MNLKAPTAVMKNKVNKERLVEMKKKQKIQNEYQYEKEIEIAAMKQIPIAVNGREYQTYQPEAISSFLQEQPEDYMAGYLIDEKGTIVLIEYNKITENN